MKRIKDDEFETTKKEAHDNEKSVLKDKEMETVTGGLNEPIRLGKCRNCDNFAPVGGLCSNCGTRN